MRVPEEAGAGKAKITVCYPAWKEGNVTPATFEVPLVETKPKAVGEERFRSLLVAERDAITSLRDLGGEVEMEGEEVVTVRLRGAKVTNDRLKLRHLPFIRSLELRDCPITNDGLKRVAGLENLTNLHIEGAPITDAGLEHLSDLKNLENLNLARTGVTDAGLTHLKGLAKLKRLNVSGTRVTEDGLKELKQALPNLELNRN